MEYEYKKLSELGRVVTGKTPPTENSEYYDGDYPFITPSDIESFDEKYLLATERSLSDLGAQELGSLVLPPQSICFVSIGSTIGKMCKTHKRSYTNQQINTLVPNENYDSDYLFYFLRYIKSYFQSIGGGTGSGKGIVNKTVFSKTKVNVLKDKTCQHKMASVLSAYDNLIEVNNKRIKVLEEMAENLYKEWFVRFRFPGHETAEFENGIPRGWNITRCKDIVPVLTGKKDANYGDDGGPYPFFTCAQEPIQAPDYSFDCAAVLLAGNCDLNAKVYKGKFEAYQRTYVLSPHNITHLFLLYYVIKDNVERLKQASTGAAISFITKGMIERIHFLLPPNELLVRFHGIMDDLYTQKDVLMKLNKNLIKQRDLLLPRLMSGKLEV